MAVSDEIASSKASNIFSHKAPITRLHRQLGQLIKRVSAAHTRPHTYIYIYIFVQYTCSNEAHPQAHSSMWIYLSYVWIIERLNLTTHPSNLTWQTPCRSFWVLNHQRAYPYSRWTGPARTMHWCPASSPAVLICRASIPCSDFSEQGSCTSTTASKSFPGSWFRAFKQNYFVRSMDTKNSQTCCFWETSYNLHKCVSASFSRIQELPAPRHDGLRVWTASTLQAASAQPWYILPPHSHCLPLSRSLLPPETSTCLQLTSFFNNWLGSCDALCLMTTAGFECFAGMPKAFPKASSAFLRHLTVMAVQWQANLTHAG